MKKRLLAVLLAVALIGQMCPCFAASVEGDSIDFNLELEPTEDISALFPAQENEESHESISEDGFVPYSDETSGNISETVSWSFDPDTGLLCLTGTGETPDYSSSTSGRPPWYNYRDQILRIEVGEGITRVGSYSFSGCATHELHLPSTLGSLGTNALTSNSKLHAIYCYGSPISGSISGHTNLVVYHLANQDGWGETWNDKPTAVFEAGVREAWVSYEVDGGTLTFDPINGMVEGYTGTPVNVTIPETIENVNVKGLAPGLFFECASLISISLPEGLTYIGPNAFYRCSALTSAQFPSTLEVLGRNAFEGCSALTNIDLSNTRLAALEPRTFTSCTKLVSASLPGTLTDIGDYAFNSCRALTSISIPEGITAIGEYAFGNCEKMENAHLPSSIETIGSSAFRGCEALSGTLALPNITFLGSQAFYECRALEAVELSGSLTEIGNSVFLRCTSLTSAVLGEGITKTSESMFDSCSKLTSVQLPSTLTEISRNTFSGCSGLTEIALPEHLSVLGYGAFNACTSLAEIQLPDTLTTVRERAFYNCRALTQIALPDGITQIEHYTFYNCSALETIKLPDTLSQLGTSVFMGCSSLTEVVFPEGITQLPSSTFQNCTSLAEVRIPSTVTTLGNQAFQGCTQLADLYFYGNAPTYRENTFASTPSNLTIHYLTDRTGWTTPTWNGIQTETFRLEGDLHYYPLSGGGSLQYDVNTGEIVGCVSLPRYVVVPAEIEGIVVTSIAAKAFQGSSAEAISIPNCVTQIGDGAFDNGVTLYSCAGSAAQTWAQDNNIPFVVHAIEAVNPVSGSNLTGPYATVRVTTNAPNRDIGIPLLVLCTNATGTEQNITYTDTLTLNQSSSRHKLVHTFTLDLTGMSGEYTIRFYNDDYGVSYEARYTMTQPENDTTNPKIVSVSPSEDYTMGPDTPIRVKVWDDTAVVSIQASYSTDNRTWTPLSNIPVPSGFNVITLPLKPGDVSRHDLWVKVSCTDASGNKSEEITRAYSVDTTPPQAPVLTAEPGDLCIEISWTSGNENDLAGFRIYRRESEQSSYSFLCSRSVESNYAYTDYAVEPDHSYSYYIEAVDENGNISRSANSSEVTPNNNDTESPVAVLWGSNTGAAGTPLTFSAEGSSDNVGVTAYRWYFGDGGQSTEEKPSHTYYQAGTYTVTLSVEDAAGNASTVDMTITIKDPEEVSQVTVTVVDESGNGIPDAGVFFQLGSDNQSIFRTNSDGVAVISTEPGAYTIGAYCVGYLPDKGGVSLPAGGSGAIRLTLIKKDIVIQDLEVKKMTEDEMERAGIDPNDPDNQEVYERTFKVAIPGVTTETEEITEIINSNGDLLSDPIKLKLPSIGGRGHRVLSIGTVQPKGPYAEEITEEITYYIEVERPTLVILDCSETVCKVKDFFDVSLTILNQADTRFVLDQCVATLEVPNGLTLMETNRTTKSPTVSMGSIRGQSSDSAEWILRADAAGAFDLGSSFTAILREFDVEINAEFRMEDPIQVEPAGETSQEGSIQSVTMIYEENRLNLLSDMATFEKGSDLQARIEVEVDWGDGPEGIILLFQNSIGYRRLTDGAITLAPGKVFDTEGAIYVSLRDQDSNTIAMKAIRLKIVEPKGPDDSTGGFRLFDKISFTVDEDKPVIGGQSFSFDVGVIPLKVEISGDGETFKMILGDDGEDTLEDKFDSIEEAVKEIESAGGTLAHINKIRAKHGISAGQTLTVKKGWETDGSAFGYIEGKVLEDGSYLVTEGGIVLGGSLEYTFEGQTFVSIVPVCFSVMAGGSIQWTSSIKGWQNGRPTPSGQLEFSVPYMEISAGVGVVYVGHVGARGRAEPTFTITFEGNRYSTVDLTGSAHFEVEALGVTVHEREFAHGTWNLYDSRKNTSGGTTGGGFGGGGGTSYALSSYAAAVPEAHWAVPAQWLGDRPEVDASSTKELRVLQTNAYAKAQPLLMEAGGKTVMVWISDNPSRTAYNKSMLVYSVYDSSADTWSAPQPISDLDTADYYPAVKDGYVVWQKATKAFDEGVSLEEIAKNTEIYIAKFNGSRFDTPERLTTNIEMDAQPQLAVNGNTVSVVWTRNSNNNIFGDTGKNTIWQKTYNGSDWSQESKISGELNTVAYLSAGYMGGSFVTAYSLDDDGDLNTINDREIYLIRNGNTTQFTHNDVLDSAPTFGEINGSPAMFWYRDSNIYYVTDLNQPAPKAVSEDRLGQLTDRYSICSGIGRTVILWTAVENGISEVHCVLFDGNQWSKDITLSETRQSARYPSGVISDQGKITIGFNRIQNVPDQDYYRDGQADLCVMDVVPSCDIELKDVFTNIDIEPGDNLPIHFTVVNVGEVTVKGISVDILAEDGSQKKHQEFDASLLAGETQDFEMSYLVASSISAESITVKISPKNPEQDRNPSNNQATIMIGQSDLKITAISDEADGDAHRIAVGVQNIGYTEASGITVTLYKDRERKNVLSQKSISVIREQNEETVTFEINSKDMPDEKGWIVLTAAVASESNDANPGNNYKGFAIKKGSTTGTDPGPGPAPGPGTDPSPGPDRPSGGNGSSSSTGMQMYPIAILDTLNGTVTASAKSAQYGNTITLTATPDSGYVLNTLTVTDSRENEIKLTAQGSGKYTFTMPSRAVTVKATFAPLPDDVERPCDGGVTCPSRSYTDLSTVGTWYHEAVDYVLRNGLMNGYNSTTFGPNDNLSRAQLAQILYNQAGKPTVTSSSVFTDVADSQWYTSAVTWAAMNDIVGGYGDGRFGPNDNITREQLAVMLWRYAGSPAATNKELYFNDADEIGGWSLDALRWAVENGVLNGYGDGRLGPKGLATRAQVAQMLKNFLDN